MPKIFRRVAVAGMLIAPMFVFAAYNDVTLTTNANITVDSVSLGVSGSSAAVQSIVVNATTFSVTLLSGSSITVSAPGKTFATSPTSGAFTSSGTCNGGNSTFTLTGTGTAVTVAVSMTGSCAAVATASSGGGGGSPSSYGSSGGGGGGGGSVPASAVTTATTNTNTTSTAAAVSTSSSATYTRALSVGSSGNDVASLQTLLESRGFLTMPAGIAKGYFGAVTKKALQAYQKSVGLDPLGIVGPGTRAKLNATSATPAVPTTVTPAVPATPASGSYTRALSVGSSGNDVSSLQILLESKGFLAMPAGVTKGYFGAATKKALQAYQKSVGITPLGNVGPATRAYLNSL